MAKKQMQAGGDAFMKKYEEWQKSGANKIELIETEPTKIVEKTEKKPSKAEVELKKAKEAADSKKKEIEETLKKEKELMA
jgi:hypothetical protein